MSLFHQPLPYCGAPPSPATLLFRWRLDPIVVSLLLVVLALYLVGEARSPSRSPLRRTLFISGWTVGALALVSPLCPLSVSLFAARASQHVILTLLAAPLVAAGRPLEAIALAVGRRPPRALVGRHGLFAAGAFALVVWFWHSPAMYDLTFVSTLLYWSMHVTMFASAWWLWSELFAADGAAPVQEVGASLVSSVQMGFLGALITLSPEPLYAPHALTTAAWGLTQLQDQQVGGAVMWVPGCLVFLCIAMIGLAKSLNRKGWSGLSPHGAEAGP